MPCPRCTCRSEEIRSGRFHLENFDNFQYIFTLKLSINCPTSPAVFNERMLVKPIVHLLQSLSFTRFRFAKFTFSNFHKLWIHFHDVNYSFFADTTRLKIEMKLSKISTLSLYLWTDFLIQSKDVTADELHVFLGVSVE